MTKYIALKGLNYPDSKGDEKRVEAGQDCSDFPEKSIKEAIKNGDIQEVKEEKKETAPKKVTE